MNNTTQTKTPTINKKIVEELLSQTEPSALFGKEGLFSQLKKQIVERVLEKELDHELGYTNCKDPQTYPKDKTNKTAYVPGKKYKAVQKTNYPSSPSNA